jgi:hypothetical protein
MRNERRQESKQRIQTLQEARRNERGGESDEAAAPQQKQHVNLFAKEESEEQALVRAQAQEQKPITRSSITPVYLDGSNQKGGKKRPLNLQSDPFQLREDINERERQRKERMDPMQSFVRSTPKPNVSSTSTSSTALVVRTSVASKHDSTCSQDDDESMAEKQQRKEQKRARKRARKEERHQRHSCKTKKTAAPADTTISMEELRQRRLDREAREQRREAELRDEKSGGNQRP